MFSIIAIIERTLFYLVTASTTKRKLETLLFKKERKKKSGYLPPLINISTTLREVNLYVSILSYFLIYLAHLDFIIILPF